MAEHAHTFSASKFEQLMLCPGSAVLTADAPRTSSQYAAEGTCIHSASANVLLQEPWPLLGYKVSADGFSFPRTQDMQDCGQAYVDYVQGLAGDSLWVEQVVRFAEPLGIPADDGDGFGTHVPRRQGRGERHCQHRSTRQPCCHRRPPDSR